MQCVGVVKLIGMGFLGPDWIVTRKNTLLMKESIRTTGRNIFGFLCGENPDRTLINLEDGKEVQVKGQRCNGHSLILKLPKLGCLWHPTNTRKFLLMIISTILGNPHHFNR